MPADRSVTSVTSAAGAADAVEADDSVDDRAEIPTTWQPRLPARLLLAIASGLVLAAMFEPIGLVVAGPLGVAGFTLCLRGLRLRAALAVGLVFGAVFSFVQLWWMRSVGTDAWIALSLIETGYFALVGPVVALLHRLRAWPAWIAGAWVAYEELRAGWPFGGFPWARLAFGTIDTPFAKLLPWVGMAGVSLVLALIGTLAAAALVRTLRIRPGARQWRPQMSVERPERGPGVAWGAGVGAIAVGVGVVALWPYEPPIGGQVISVAAVQGDVPGAGDDVVAVHRDVTRNHVDSTIDLAEDVAAGEVAEPRFVVWPENSTAVDPFTDARTNEGINAAVAAIGVPVVVGGIVDAVDDGQVLNQGIVWNPTTGPGDRYNKHHPVPFGEYIPFRSDTLTDLVSQLDLIPRDMLAGVRASPLDVAGVKVANAICFDVAYDDLFREQVTAGAQVLTVQTSNAMFIRTHQIDQQFEITRLRAIESGRYLVVAAINGRSGIIAPDGEVIATVPKQTQAVVSGEVVLIDATPPGLQVSLWIARLTMAATILGVALILVPVRRHRADAGRDAASTHTSSVRTSA